MPADPELDRLLKSLGAKTGGVEADRPQPKAGGGARAAPAPEPESSSDDTGFFSGVKSFGTGLVKGAGAEVESGLEFIPGYKGTGMSKWVKEHTAEGEDEGASGQVGRLLGSAVPWMAIPEIGLAGRLGSMATRWAGRAYPKVIRGAKGRMASNPALKTRTGQFATQTLPVLARTAGRATEHVAVGAGAGAVADPENPLQGAAIGAGLGLAPMGLGGLARAAQKSGLLAHIGSHRLRHYPAHFVSATLLNHALGLGPLGYAVYPAIATGPIGRQLGRGAHVIVNQAGRIVGAIPGPVAESIARGVAGGGATAISGAMREPVEPEGSNEQAQPRP